MKNKNTYQSTKVIELGSCAFRQPFAECSFDIAAAHVDALTSGRCWVSKVEVFEHENNSAICLN